MWFYTRWLDVWLNWSRTGIEIGVAPRRQEPRERGPKRLERLYLPGSHLVALAESLVDGADLTPMLADALTEFHGQLTDRWPWLDFVELLRAGHLKRALPAYLNDLDVNELIDASDLVEYPPDPPNDATDPSTYVV